MKKCVAMSAAVVLASLISTASCAGRPIVTLQDEEVLIMENGVAFNSRGDTVPLTILTGWYLVSPGKMVKIVERGR